MVQINHEKVQDTVIERFSSLPMADASACLIILESQFAATDGRVHPLTKGQTLLGRDAEADIRFADHGVSRRHAKVVREGEHAILVDLGSRNGSRVNGNIIHQKQLSNGDMVQLGTVAKLKYVVQDPLEVRCAYLLDQAQETIRQRDEFLSIASHELKTPLTALLLQIQTVKRTLTTPSPSIDPPKLLNRMAILERQAGRLNQLISQLLDVSRVRVGRLELQREPVDLVGLVQDVLTASQEELVQAGCEVFFEAKGRPVGLWDRSRIEQVVTNLMANARKYGRERPVRLLIEEDFDGAHLTVIDEGIGITVENQSRIFERFERAASPRHFGGLGLGLYIVRTILDAHGGRIEVASELGKGSTFRIFLPLLPPVS